MTNADTAERTGRRALWSLLKLLPRASRWRTAGLASVLVLQGLLSPLQITAVGLLVGRLSATVGSGTGSPATRRALLALALVAGAYLGAQLVRPAISILSGGLARRLSAYAAHLVIHGALAPVGIAQIEAPAVADDLSIVRGKQAGTLPVSRGVPLLVSLFQARIVGLSSALLLVGFRWWAPFPLAAAWVLTGVERGRAVRMAVGAQNGSTTQLRRAGYLRGLALDGSAAKEVRVFGLSDWLTHQFTGSWVAGLGQLGRRSGSGRTLVGTIVLVAAHAMVLVPLAVTSADGTTSVGEVAVVLQAVAGVALFGWIGDVQWMLAMAAATAPAVSRVAGLAAEDPLARASRGCAPAPAPRHAISVSGVGFVYPAGGRPALSDVSMTIPAGSSVALVGVNGAGKSTLVKLLTRLYDPTAGQIRIDGVDLRGLDPQSWRRQIAIVAQDFIRYGLSVRDNVGLGCPQAPRDDDALARVADVTGLDDLVARLPLGWDTPLSRQFAGGSELSGGQWQRVALARALFAVEHGARFLILDEPTAHLDVLAETDLYKRLLDLAGDVTVLLISHRFTTVRQADMICVLDGGRVVEQGNHDELVAADGLYADMFQVQAAPFRESTGSDEHE